MVLFMALILVMIWVSMIAWIYWVVNPFTQQLWNIQRYNQAYYWAIASVERAMLVLRGHTAGFSGSWGWINWSTYGNASDYENIVQRQYFDFLTLTWHWNGIFWKIDNLTDWVIPKPGKWDLDPDYSSWNDYLKLTFDKPLQYAFYKDTSNSSEFYTWVTDANIQNIPITNSVDVSIRVPQKLYDKYGGGNALDEYTDLDQDGIINDIIVNRTLFWYTWDMAFAIFPTVSLQNDTVASYDTTIREDVINWYSTTPVNVRFNTTYENTNPCEAGNHTQDIDKFNQSPDWAVSTGFDLVLNNGMWVTVANSKANNKISQMHLKFSLVNLLKHSEEKVYPYLEVKLEAKDWWWGISIPDMNFHILWEWKVIDYDVKIIITKPVFDASVASDFTVLF